MKTRDKYLLGGLGVIIIVICIAYIPKWQLSYYESVVVEKTGKPLFKTAKEYIDYEDKFRKTVIQIFGGLIVIFGLYLTYRRIRASEKQAESFRVGQITESFTRAIDQLGAVTTDGRINLEIRLGGIYALERISKDSGHDHVPIMEILTAYVRKHTHWTRKAREKSETGWIAPYVSIDIQAILTVIGRRNLEHEKETNYRIDLSNTSLEGADLTNATLSGSNLKGTNFEGAGLRKTKLRNAEGLSAEQLCKAKTLYQAQLDPGLKEQIKHMCPHLLAEPKNES